MEKNKLGIVINTTKVNNRTRGFRSIYHFNDDEWSSVVRDTGAELKMVTNDSASAPIHFIQFENDGCCYCIIQSIAGRKDYQSAWIFIHKDIMLPTGTLVSVIKRVEEILSLDPEDNTVVLDELFGTSYPTTDNPSYSASTGESYAVRYYGNGTDFMYTRQQVLEENLYQSAYCRYKSVFLVDKESGQTVSGVDDLTNTKLEKSLVIELPDEIDGFRHDLGSNSRRITNGDSIRVRWTRAGYAPIDKEGCTTEQLLINRSEYRRSFRLNLFRVVDKVTGDTLNVLPEFTGKRWVDDRKNPRKYYFKEEDLTNITCKVVVHGYVPFIGELDLTKPNDKGEYVIGLEPERHVYRCYIETDIKDARTVEFTITTQYALNGKELPGFQFDGVPSEKRDNRLFASNRQTVVPHVGSDAMPVKWGNHTGLEVSQPTRKGHRKKSNHLFLYALIGILGIAIISGFYIGYRYVIQIPKSQNSIVENDSADVNDPAVVEDDSSSDWEQTKEYLRLNNTKWIETEMNQRPGLDGVYVMIRDYQFANLKSFIDKHSDLKEINEWKRLYDIAKENKDKKGMWSDGGSIDIEKYLNTDFKKKEDVGSSSGNTTVSSHNNNSPVKGRNRNGTSSTTGRGNGNKSGTRSDTQDKLN